MMRANIQPIFEDILDFWKNYEKSHSYIKKFLKKIFIDEKTDCWLFTGTIGKTGYGMATLLDKTNGAHRFSYRIFRGKIPKGLFVCHKCDIRNCCNPYHLWLGNNLENIQDMIDKGRQAKPEVLSLIMIGKNIGDKNGMRKHPERRATKENGRHISVINPSYSNNSGDNHWSHKNPEKMLELRRRVIPKGSKHGQAKLNEEKVLKILKLLKKGISMVEISKKFNVTSGLISHIKHGRAWTHVKLEDN